MEIIKLKHMEDRSTFRIVVSDDHTTRYGVLGRVRDMVALGFLTMDQEPNPWAWVFIDEDGDMLYELDPVVLQERMRYRIERFG